MNNLTPEQRPDRNGNVVTRWVNAFKNRKTAARKPIPAPALSDVAADEDDYSHNYSDYALPHRNAQRPRRRLTDAERDERRELSRTARSVLDRNDSYERICSANIDFVIDHDPKLMQEVLDACSGDKEISEFLIAKFNHQYISPSGYGEYYDADGNEFTPEYVSMKLAKVRTALAVAPKAKSLFTTDDVEDVSHHHAIYFLDRAVAHYVNESEAPADRLQACTTIAYIHGVHLQDIEPDEFTPGDDEIDFFTENAAHIEPLVQTLLERRSTDVELVRSLMEGSPALAEGML